MRFSNNISSLTISENAACFPMATPLCFAPFGGEDLHTLIADSIYSNVGLRIDSGRKYFHPLIALNQPVQSLKSGLKLNKPSSVFNEPVSVLKKPSSVFNELVSVLHKPLSVFNEHSSVLKEPSCVFDEHSRVLKKPSSVFDKHSSVSFQKQQFFGVFVLYPSILLSTLYFLIKTNKL